MLALVFGLEKFHHYVYGRHVDIITYHKPLVSIVTKDCHLHPDFYKAWSCVSSAMTIRYSTGHESQFQYPMPYLEHHFENLMMQY